jgi:hypothetical protein
MEDTSLGDPSPGSKHGTLVRVLFPTSATMMNDCSVTLRFRIFRFVIALVCLAILLNTGCTVVTTYKMSQDTTVQVLPGWEVTHWVRVYGRESPPDSARVVIWVTLNPQPASPSHSLRADSVVIVGVYDGVNDVAPSVVTVPLSLPKWWRGRKLINGGVVDWQTFVGSWNNSRDLPDDINCQVFYTLTNIETGQVNAVSVKYDLEKNKELQWNLVH